MREKPYVENALFLIALTDSSGKTTTFYDEEDQSTHELENGVLSISTDFADYTTYKIKAVGDSANVTLDIQVERLDNYKLHDKAKTIVCPLEEDDESDLAERLARLVDQVKMAQKKKAPTKSETQSLEAMMIPAGEWEWKEWPEIGTSEIQKAAKKSQIGLSLKTPTDAEKKAVFSSGDFTRAMLEWFRTQLHPQGWSLVAPSTIDELQEFFLVRVENVEAVRELLKKQGRRLL